MREYQRGTGEIGRNRLRPDISNRAGARSVFSARRAPGVQGILMIRRRARIKSRRIDDLEHAEF